MRFLKERIKLTQRPKDNAKREVQTASDEIRSQLTTEDGCKILRELNKTPREFLKTSNRSNNRNLPNWLRRNSVVSVPILLVLTNLGEQFIFQVTDRR